MKSKRAFFTLSLAAAGFLAAAAVAAVAAPGKPDMAIAAVVGQDAISSYDVESRMAFIITTAKLSNTPEVMQRLRPQVIRALIDEKLQLQDAARNEIAVSEQEISQTVAGIEHDRGMSPGAIFQIMEKNRIPKDTFTGQLRAQLAWRKLVLKRVRPGVRVSDEEVRLMQMSPSGGGTAAEMQIALFTLPVDSPSRELEIRHASEKIASELRGGANFEEISRQLSGASAEKFWIRPEQMDPAIVPALAQAQAGTTTPPIRTGAGYTIVKVYETRTHEDGAPVRDEEVQLKEILLKLKPDAPEQEAKALLSIAEDVAKHPGACEDQSIAGIEDIKEAEIEVHTRQELLSALPAGIRAITETLKIGEISTPLASDSGIRLYMLCGRKDAASSVAAFERTRNRLFLQKLDLEAQKYLMSLRRETYIEIR